MSESESGSGAGRREVAYRLFASEFDDATVSYSESDEERAPNYVISPTGGRVNRLFLVGVLTELDQVNQDMLRARIVDPTGPFIVYAGQYQPDALSFLEQAEPPTFVAVTGKARTFQPEDSNVVYSSVRPETISEVDAETRDRWVVQTAEQTLERVATMAAAKQTGRTGEQLREALESEGIDSGHAHGVALALDHYGTTGEYLVAIRKMALDAARMIAGEREEVDPPALAPDEGGEVDLDTLARKIDEDAFTPSTQAEMAEEPTEDIEEPTPTAETRERAGDEASTESTEPDPESAESEVEPEPTAETVESTAAETGEPAGAEEELGDFEPGEFDLDEEEREEIEEEYGTEFETGNEVDEPGEASIEPETEEPETEAEPESPAPGTQAETMAGAEASEAESATGTEAESEPDIEEPETVEESETGTAAVEAEREEPEVESEPESDVAEPEAEPAADEPPPEDIDIDDAVMETMEDLSDGEGADREELVTAVAEEYGVDPAEVEDAIQDALMSGRCYEPDEGRLMPI